MSIISASIEYDMFVIRSTAKYNSTPVTTHMRRTDVRAPNTSALYHPNGMDWVAGLEATHKAHRDIIKLAKSVSKCEASVAIAKLLDKYPPVTKTIFIFLSVPTNRTITRNIIELWEYA